MNYERKITSDDDDDDDGISKSPPSNLVLASSQAAESKTTDRKRKSSSSISPSSPTNLKSAKLKKLKLSSSDTEKSSGVEMMKSVVPPAAVPVVVRQITLDELSDEELFLPPVVRKSAVSVLRESSDDGVPQGDAAKDSSDNDGDDKDDNGDKDSGDKDNGDDFFKTGNESSSEDESTSERPVQKQFNRQLG